MWSIISPKEIFLFPIWMFSFKMVPWWCIINEVEEKVGHCRLYHYVILAFNFQQMLVFCEHYSTLLLDLICTYFHKLRQWLGTTFPPSLTMSEPFIHFLALPRPAQAIAQNFFWKDFFPIRLGPCLVVSGCVWWTSTTSIKTFAVRACGRSSWGMSASLHKQ